MNKFGVAMLSALATIGIGAGLVFVAGRVPAVNKRLNIGFDTNKNNINDNIGGGNIDLDNPAMDDDSFKEELNKRGFVIVNYSVDDKDTYIVTPKDSVIDYSNIPKKDGFYFIGWSNIVDGLIPIVSVDNNINLYPIFKGAVDGVVDLCDYLGNIHRTTIKDAYESLWKAQEVFIKDGITYSLNFIGFSNSPDKLDLVGELIDGCKYYMVYNISPLNSALTSVSAYDNFYKLIYGEQAFDKIQVVLPFEELGDTSIYIRDNALEGLSVISALNDQFRCIGVSNNPDGKELIPTSNWVKDSGYYGVYQSVSTGDIYSMQEMKDIIDSDNAKMPIEVELIDGNNVGFKLYDKSQMIELLSNQEGFIYNGERYSPIGFSYNAESVEVADEFYDGQVYFLVYANADGTSLLNVKQINRDLYLNIGEGTYASREYAISISSLDYEGESYELIGWSLSADSIDILTPDDLLMYAGVTLYPVVLVNEIISSYAQYLDFIGSNVKHNIIGSFSGVYSGLRQISRFERNIKANGTYYRFLGWSYNNDSIQLLDDVSDMESCYAVYEDCLNNEVLDYMTFNGRVEGSSYEVVDEVPERISVDMKVVLDNNGSITMGGWIGFDGIDVTPEMAQSQLYDVNNIIFEGWAYLEDAQIGSLRTKPTNVFIIDEVIRFAESKTLVALYSFDDRGTVRYVYALEGNESIISSYCNRNVDVNLSFTWLDTDSTHTTNTSTQKNKYSIDNNYIRNTLGIRPSSYEKVTFVGWTSSKFTGTKYELSSVSIVNFNTLRNYYYATNFYAVYSFEVPGGIEYVCACAESIDFIENLKKYPAYHQVQTLDGEVKTLKRELYRTLAECGAGIITFSFTTSDNSYSYYGMGLSGNTTISVPMDDWNDSDVYYTIYKDSQGNLITFDEAVILSGKSYQTINTYDGSIITIPNYYFSDVELNSYRELYNNDIVINDKTYSIVGVGIDAGNREPLLYQEVSNNTMEVFAIYKDNEGNYYSADEMMMEYENNIVRYSLKYYTPEQVVSSDYRDGELGQSVVLTQSMQDELNVLNDETLTLVGWSKTLTTGALTSVDYITFDDYVLDVDIQLYAVYTYTRGGQQLYLMACDENIEMLDKIYNPVYLTYNVYLVDTGLTQVNVEDDVNLHDYLKNTLPLIAPANNPTNTMRFLGLSKSGSSISTVSKDSITTNETYYATYIKTTQTGMISYDNAVKQTTNNYVMIFCAQNGFVDVPAYYFLEGYDISYIDRTFSVAGFVVGTKTYELYGLSGEKESKELLLPGDIGLGGKMNYAVYTDNDGNIYSCAEATEIYNSAVVEWAVAYFDENCQARTVSSRGSFNESVVLDTAFFRSKTQVSNDYVTFVGWTFDGTLIGAVDEVDYFTQYDLVEMTDDFKIYGVYSFVDDSGSTKYITAMEKNKYIFANAYCPGEYSPIYYEDIDGLHTTYVKNTKTNGSEELNLAVKDKVIEINGETYKTSGFSSSADSDDMLGYQSILPNNTYYVLYYKDGWAYSLNTIKEMINNNN